MFDHVKGLDKKKLGRVGKSESHVYFLALTCSDAEQLGKPFLLKGNFIHLYFTSNHSLYIWLIICSQSKRNNYNN